ncbi:unnamed protein product, partial [marine sediment metagenome]
MGRERQHFHLACGSTEIRLFFDRAVYPIGYELATFVLRT